MWIVTNKGFMSIVAKDAAGKPSGDGEDAIVSVRFRRPKDAAALFPDHDFVATPTGDYCGRIFATRMEVAVALAKMTLGLDYTNFKSSIKGDPKLSTAAHDAWTDFGRLQEGGPYGGRSPYYEPPKGKPSYQEDLWRSGVDPLAVRKPRKAKARRDPYCEGCGKRFGANKLDRDGYCDDCSRFFAEPASAGSGDGFEADPDTGGGVCWNCETHAAERDRFKLCANCAPLYADVEDLALMTLAESAE